MCVFCKIAQGQDKARIVYEDDEVVAFHDVNPQAPTHVLVIPRKHISSLDSAEPEDVMLLGRLLLAAHNVAATLGLSAPGYRVVINNGSGAGQSVFHLHLHVLGGRRMRWPPG